MADEKMAGKNEQRNRDIQMIQNAAQRIMEICDQANLGCIIAYGEPAPPGEEGYKPIVVLNGDVATLCVLEKNIDATVMMSACPELLMKIMGAMATGDEYEEEDEDEGGDYEDVDEGGDADQFRVGDATLMVDSDLSPVLPPTVPESHKDGYTPADTEKFECKCGEVVLASECMKNVYAESGGLDVVNVITEYLCPQCSTTVKKYRQTVR